MARTAKRNQHAPQPVGEIHDDPMSWLRSYQIPPARALFIDHKDRFWISWNRKTGKTCFLCRLARMWLMHGFFHEHQSKLCLHSFPDFKTAKDTIWDGPWGDRRLIDVAFPPELREEFSETECFIRLKDGYGTRTGPTYHLEGSKERMQSRRGPNASMVILDEYQDHAPGVFGEIYEPMVVSNRGVAIFVGTHRGKNHHYRLGLYAQAESQKPGSRWFHSFQTCETTRRDAPGEDGAPVTPLAEIEEMRRRGEDEGRIQQEHFNSPDGSVSGAILSGVLEQARREGRLTRVVREANLPVGVCLDIGRSDGTAMWFYQTIGREVRLLAYEAFKAQDVQTSAAEEAIRRIVRRPYIVTRAILPHDAMVKGYSAAESTYELFERAVQEVVCDTRKTPVEQGIEMLRGAFPRLVIDQQACGQEQEQGLPSGMDSLRNWHRAKDQTGDETGAPVHDPHSHGADALRYGAMEGFSPLNFPNRRRDPEPLAVELAFDPCEPVGNVTP